MKILWECEECRSMNEADAEIIPELRYFSGELMCDVCGHMQFIDGLVDCPPFEE